MQTHAGHDHDSTTRVISRVIRDLVGGGECFDECADFTHALRMRLIRLRIRYTQAEFDDAIARVGATRPLWTGPVVPPRSRSVDAPSSAITRHEADTLLDGLRSAIRSMPGADRHHEDRVRRQAALFRQVRRPLADRLEEIFSGDRERDLAARDRELAELRDDDGD